MNTFGNIFRLTSFGESHGPAIGGVIDGIPSQYIISLSAIQNALDRRRPGSNNHVSPRQETDRLEILSGLMSVDENEQPIPFDPTVDKAITLGSPIGFIVRNINSRSEDYKQLQNIYRPSHADLTYDAKYGIRDWRGGGRSSGRETISRVVAGAFASQILNKYAIRVTANVTEIAGCTDSSQFDKIITETKADGDSVGGIVSCRISGLTRGIGEPIFAKFQQMLASAMLSIGGVHGFEYGDGFRLAEMKGSDAADQMSTNGYLSNHCGGILGGISNGEEINFRVAFKPTPSIAKPLQSIDSNGNQVSVSTHGRHDPCIAIRGAEVVKAMAAIVIFDGILMNKVSRNISCE